MPNSGLTDGDTLAMLHGRSGEGGMRNQPRKQLTAQRGQFYHLLPLVAQTCPEATILRAGTFGGAL